MKQVKRALDVVVAGLVLVVAAPVLLLVAIAIKWTSRGPVLFRQERLGLNQRPFTILKFRTMVAGADERREALITLNDAKGCIFKMRNDPRLTPIGGFLRRNSLDELPQLVNVLRGEMSLVGPRPIPRWVFSQIAPQYFRRFDVLPGMTGRWQVRGRIQDSQRMLEDDLYYVEHWSMWTDLRILAATPRALIERVDQYPRPPSPPASQVAEAPGAARRVPRSFVQ